MKTSVATASSNDFYIDLLEFLVSSKQRIIAIGAELGLTAMQAITLLLSTGDKPRSMNSFCRLYNCDASNITGIIDGLEQKGLVSRQGNPHDRRVKVIQLEAEGQSLRLELLKRLDEKSGFLFDALSSSEAAQLRSLIMKLAAYNKCS